MVNWVRVSAIGGATISASTLLAALYLFFSLMRQGRGKLRVQLLLGMVVSDLCLGIIAFVPEVIYLANGKGLRTGSHGCNVHGFFLTSVLFSQHLWTLTIAFATYLLLKHPLSRTLILFEKYFWATTPVIWAISFIHAAIWWVYVGWATSGALCYYAAPPNESSAHGRSLMQFIPRASVFVTIVALYSTLFSFLRRPDTIQLSSGLSSGIASGHLKTPIEETDGRPGMSGVLKKFGSKKGSAKPINNDAPWEQLEFVTVGGRSWASDTPPQTHTDYFVSGDSTINTESLYASTPSSSAAPHDAERGTKNRLGSIGSTDRTPIGSDISPVSHRPSETETLVEAPSEPSKAPSDFRASVKLPHLHYTTHILSPAVSKGGLSFDAKSIALETPIEDEDVLPIPGTRRASGQSLKEFFQQNVASGLENVDEMGEEVRLGGTDGRMGKQMSASTYFNRQASLLMLYFPLAYIVVFSVSLGRLIHDMSDSRPDPLLNLISLWMILSVGLIDGLVYGVAEFLVRRRVRRKMPDRL